MKKSLILKATLNKCNGQVNLNLPRKKIPDKLLDNILNFKQAKVIFEDW